MSARSCAGLLLCAALAATTVAPGPSAAGPGGVDAAGLLVLPEEQVAPVPAGLVIVLHEPTGIDPRGWGYADQIAAAGLAVLHLDVLEMSADGFVPPDAADEDASALARLVAVIGLLDADPRFAPAPLGVLAFGGAAQTAARITADPAASARIGALALLYPGCDGVADRVVADDARPRAPA
ncbi:dienelactone hydrolase family protein, partial [Falsiroseomonas oryziterrae]|uniref:hypothetical protein n=1 Tax=Falsiroseomonas oryziterrae TaxID=2911368 RepID=UPI0035567B08